MIPFLKMLCQINKFQHAIIPIEMDRRGSHADYFGRKGTWKRSFYIPTGTHRLTVIKISYY